MSTPVIAPERVALVSRVVIDTVAELHSGTEPLRVDSRPQEAYLLGWWVALRREAAGVVVLADAGLAYESASLLRGMVEHSVLIRLTIQKPNAWRTLERARVHSTKKFEAWLTDHGYEDWSELLKLRQNLSRPSTADDPSSDNLSSFAGQARALGQEGDSGYARYQYLTHHSHASVETAMCFVKVPGCDCSVCQGELPLDSPTPEAMAAMILLEVAAMLDALLPSHPWAEVIAQMEGECEPIREAFGGAPFHINRPSPTWATR